MYKLEIGLDSDILFTWEKQFSFLIYPDGTWYMWDNKYINQYMGKRCTLASLCGPIHADSPENQAKNKNKKVDTLKEEMSKNK